MPEAVITYARVDETLCSLGFAVRTVAGKARIYKHEVTGATVYLPDVSLADEALPHHLMVVRTVLSDYNIADPSDLASKLQRAS